MEGGNVVFRITEYDIPSAVKEGVIKVCRMPLARYCFLEQRHRG
jgi:hypothetical protein